MKQKLQELKIKLQLNKGSILVCTLIIAAILLTAALSISAVTMRERKNAGKAIETAEAATITAVGCPSKIFCADLTNSKKLTDAVQICGNLNGNWHLPTAEELTCFLGDKLNCVAPGYAWTRTPAYNSQDKWIAIGASAGWKWTSSYSDGQQKVVCVSYDE